MKLQSLLALLPACSALALPRPASAATAAEPSFTPTGPLYYLKTKLVASNDTTKAKYDGLYLSSYHTGAGESDAVLESGSDSAIQGFLNDTAATGESHQEFDFGNDFPWGMSFTYEPYAGWSPVTIDAGYGDDDFIFTASGLASNLSQFGGWMACDWWHEQVQLFWKFSYYNDTLPSSCASVYLVKEDV